jgi:hypothetical protein
MGNGKGTGFARDDEGEWFSNGKGPIPERALPQRLCEVAAKGLICFWCHIRHFAVHTNDDN